GCPGGTVQPGVEMVGQGPGQVRHQTTTGHVRVGVYVHRLGEGHAVLGVDTGRGEQHLSQNTVELRNVCGKVHPGPFHDVAYQRVPVGVRPGGSHRDHRITHTDPFRAEDRIALDHPGTGPGQVVLVGIHRPRMLGGLPTDEGTTGLVTTFGDPTDDLGDPLGHHGAAGDVVGHEQRFGATDHQIVDHHRHQVDTDRVVFVHLLGEHQFRADPVGG